MRTRFFKFKRMQLAFAQFPVVQFNLIVLRRPKTLLNEIQLRHTFSTSVSVYVRIDGYNACVYMCGGYAFI